MAAHGSGNCSLILINIRVLIHIALRAVLLKTNASAFQILLLNDFVFVFHSGVVAVTIIHYSLLLYYVLLSSLDSSFTRKSKEKNERFLTFSSKCFHTISTFTSLAHRAHRACRKRIDLNTTFRKCLCALNRNKNKLIIEWHIRHIRPY